MCNDMDWLRSAAQSPARVARGLMSSTREPQPSSFEGFSWDSVYMRFDVSLNNSLTHSKGLVKRHRGEPGHTRDTRAHTSTRADTGVTDEPHSQVTTIQTHQHTRTRTTARRPNPRPAQQPQPRSRTLPAADKGSSE